MSSSVAASQILRVLRRDPAFWVPAADIFAMLTALALPWSTSLVAIFVLCWLGSVALTMDYRVFAQSLKHPMCFLPFALVGLALLGTLWSDAPWNERLYAVGPTLKFLVLPGLFYHFERSARGMWVLVAFLVSCTLMMVMSFIVVLDPSLTPKPKGEETCGIFVKNYIDQGQEFSLCILALAYPVMMLLREKKWLVAAVLVPIMLGFVANMVFVISSRTSLATMPILLLLFGLRYLPWRSVAVLSAVIAIVGSAWAVSPRICRTADTFSRDIELYQKSNIPTSAGLRLEFWKKSLQFIGEAPVMGHGTGSIRGLFERAAVGTATGASAVASAQVIGNPHNQTLNVAVQWGAIGTIMLYAMWLAHLLIFRADGLIAWIGFLVVVQNILTSLFNSHMFDFHEGWIYVLGVGVTGGMTLAAGPASTKTALP